MRCLVLEKSTVEPLLSVCKKLRNHIGVLNHPLLDHEVELAGQAPENPCLPLRIAMLGQATVAKGLSTFVRLAKQLNETHPGKTEFHIVGRLASNVADFDLGPIIIHSKQSQALHTKAAEMARSAYLRLARSMHYICLPYNGRYYHSGASGVFYDAINLSRPLILTPTPNVEDSFAAFGDIGWLCADEEEMLATITGLIEDLNVERYKNQVENLSKARECYLPDRIGTQFREWVASDNKAMHDALSAA